MNSTLRKTVAAFDSFVRCLKTWNCVTLPRQFISFMCSEESQGTTRHARHAEPWLFSGHRTSGLVNCLHAIPQYTKAMSAFTAELIGTMLLILLGDGVVANVLLNKSKGQNAGWMVITTGWGLAVAVAVYAVGA